MYAVLLTIDIARKIVHWYISVFQNMFQMIIKWLYVQSLQVVWYFDTRLHTLNRNWLNKLTYECMNIWIWFKWFRIICQWYSNSFALAWYHKQHKSLWSLSAVFINVIFNIIHADLVRHMVIRIQFVDDYQNQS